MKRLLNFNQKPINSFKVKGKEVAVFSIKDGNIDKNTVDSFGEEWSKFNDFSDTDLNTAGRGYFDIVPEVLYKGKVVLDLGCGTGRWSKYLSEKAKYIEAIDPSSAVISAATMLLKSDNVRVTQASIDNIPFEDGAFDFVFSLGVLHHIPDTQLAMRKCVNKVKPGGYFLVYLYYSLDNRGVYFKILFWASNIVRIVISRLPSIVKKYICDVLAVFIYLPLISVSRLLTFLGLSRISKKIPLSYYVNKSINIIRNDALDRFGTPLEQRFSKKEIESMMILSGLSNVVFSDSEPYWVALGQKI
jgi:2-polyprenyl-3-methyl-5-hydroxy-6-metoxy-1,4-benzoquinol methylase